MPAGPGREEKGRKGGSPPAAPRPQQPGQCQVWRQTPARRWCAGPRQRRPRGTRSAATRGTRALARRPQAPPAGVRRGAAAGAAAGKAAVRRRMRARRREAARARRGAAQGRRATPRPRRGAPRRARPGRPRRQPRGRSRPQRPPGTAPRAGCPFVRAGPIPGPLPELPRAAPGWRIQTRGKVPCFAAGRKRAFQGGLSCRLRDVQWRGGCGRGALIRSCGEWSGKRAAPGVNEAVVRSKGCARRARGGTVSLRHFKQILGSPGRCCRGPRSLLALNTQSHITYTCLGVQEGCVILRRPVPRPQSPPWRPPRCS
jgi:hypothetical protein